VLADAGSTPAISTIFYLIKSSTYNKTCFRVGFFYACMKLPIPKSCHLTTSKWGGGISFWLGVIHFTNRVTFQ